MTRHATSWLIGLLLLGTLGYALAEDVTVTTYYPSPRGIYKQIQTTDDTFLATQGGGVGIGTTIPAAKLTIQDGAILAQGVSGPTPAIGGGRRLMWIPAKGAFRAGDPSGNQWDDGNIGTMSVAFGSGNIASGVNSTALGALTTASGSNALAAGLQSIAGGDMSLAFGSLVTASGSYSVAIGNLVTAGAKGAMTIGTGVDAPITPLNNALPNSLMIGFNSNLPTLFVGPSAGVGTTGRVGIGTAAPLAPAILAVNGPVRITDGSQQDGYVLTSDAGGLAGWAPGPGQSISFSPVVVSCSGAGNCALNNSIPITNSANLGTHKGCALSEVAMWNSSGASAWQTCRITHNSITNQWVLNAGPASVPSRCQAVCWD